ncbi:hypothetical protein CSQ89_11325 [Chitinimonas sp. BJB300]|nr:hypothetical protein CSQ89_11325 [Chitinimonas sp. BJB300]
MVFPLKPTHYPFSPFVIRGTYRTLSNKKALSLHYVDGALSISIFLMGGSPTPQDSATNIAVEGGHDLEPVYDLTA